MLPNGCYKLITAIPNAGGSKRNKYDWYARAEFSAGVYLVSEAGIQQVKPDGTTTGFLVWTDTRAKALASHLTIAEDTVQTILADSGDPLGILIHLVVSGRVSLDELRVARHEFEALESHADLAKHIEQGYQY